MDKSFPQVTVWHHSAEPRDAKTMTLGTDLHIRTSHSCQILIFLHKIRSGMQEYLLTVPSFRILTILNLRWHTAAMRKFCYLILI